jgi:regulatory protein
MRSRSKKQYDEAALYEYALAALGRQMRTVAELKRLLRTKVAAGSDDLIERVVERLKDYKFLNDTNYAATYSRYRQENEKFGRRRVISDLKAKGVHDDVIEKTVGAAYQDVREEELARQFLARKRVKQPASQKDSARIFRMLVRAGFASSAIFKVLKQWKVEDEVLEALNSEADELEAGSPQRHRGTEEAE